MKREEKKEKEENIENNFTIKKDNIQRKNIQSKNEKKKKHLYKDKKIYYNINKIDNNIKIKLSDFIQENKNNIKNKKLIFFFNENNK